MMENKVMPKLRFREFSGAWEERKLSELLIKYSESNKDEEFNINEILSLSSTQGIVNRQELLDDTYSNVNHLNYKKTRLNDLVYGKSITSSYPYGLFKVNDCKDGLLSTLYFTFKVTNKVTPKFLDCYFSLTNRTNNFLKKFVVVGDRYITVDADFLLTGKIYIPNQIVEQEKIANYLSALDEKINLLSAKEKELLRYKKAMMQKLFGQEIRFNDGEGKAFAEWEEKKLGEVISIKGGYAFKSDSFKESGIPIIRISNISSTTNVIDTDNLVYYDEVTIADSYKVYKGELLVALSGATTGKACVYDLSTYSYVNQRVGVFKSLNRCYYPFISQFVLSDLFAKALVKMLVAGAQPNISTSDLESIDINIPKSIAEQQKIADFLSAIDEKINKAQEKIEETKSFKKAMLQQMFV